MKLTKLTGKKAEGFEIKVKRFYLPYLISDECPTCGETVEWSDYLSFPTLGRPEPVNFAHEVQNDTGKYEEHEWEREVLVDITVTPV